MDDGHTTGHTVSTDPDQDTAAWAEFDQHIAGAEQALDEIVDHIALGLARIPPEHLLAGLLLELGNRGQTTATAIAGLAVLRLAKAQVRARP